MLRGTGPRAQALAVAAPGLNSGDALAELLHSSAVVIPGPGIKSVSPTLAGRFLNTGPPGKPDLGLLMGNLNLLVFMIMINKQKFYFPHLTFYPLFFSCIIVAISVLLNTLVPPNSFHPPRYNLQNILHLLTGKISGTYSFLSPSLVPRFC